MRAAVGLVGALERAAVTLELSLEPLVGPGGDLGDVFPPPRAGVTEVVEVELAGFVFDVDAVERQRMEVRIQAERGVGPLDSLYGFSG